MKKILPISLVILLAAPSAWSAQSCSEQLREVVRRREKVDKISTVPSVGLVALGIVGSNPLFFVSGIMVKLPFTLSARHAKKIASLITDAHSHLTIPTKPESDALKKLLKKINKHKSGNNVTITQLSQAIVDADREGSLCSGEKVPERGDIIEVVEGQI